MITKIHKDFVSGPIYLIVLFIAFLLVRSLKVSEGEALYLWTSTAIQTGTAFFLLYLNQTFAIINHRSCLPAIFYLLLTGTDSSLCFDRFASVSALTVGGCFFFLFATYQKANSQKEILNISLLLSITGLYQFNILFILPFFWYGMYKFKSLNIRTFFASLTGVIFVYLLVFCWSVYADDMDFFSGFFPDIESFRRISTPSFDAKERIVAAVIVLQILVSGAKIYMLGFSAKIQSVTFLKFFYICSIAGLIVAAFHGQYRSEWLLIFYIPVSFLFAHYFTFIRNKWNSWLLFFTIIVLFILSMMPDWPSTQLMCQIPGGQN
ncbi:MAG: hypothetical protein LBH12_04690 [Dysgonamonadaceae bacterium]|jgi:hypothetical protein|nr:hypothetical protein [Dysgonamonadaceae bacterium]